MNIVTLPRINPTLSRRFVTGAGLLWLFGCSEDAPPRRYAAPSYTYLTPLRLKVASIEIDDSWVPAAGVPDISTLSPMQPIDALRRMAQDRLIAVGSGGRAVFRIEDAGINRIGDQLQGHLGVLLDIYTSENVRTAYAEARVARASILIGRGLDTLRSALYDLTKLMMTDMNVEFEYQVRRSLHDWLDNSAESGPAVPAPVTQTPLDGGTPSNNSAIVGPTPLQAPPPQSVPAFTAPEDSPPIQRSPPPGFLGTLPQSDLLPPSSLAPTSLAPPP
jgi:hypothetical protein